MTERFSESIVQFVIFQSKRQLTSSHWGWDIASLNDKVCYPSYLVTFHCIGILGPCRIIVNAVWSSRWGSWKQGSITLQEQCMSFCWCPSQAPYLWRCQIPSHSVCIHMTACKYHASCILKKTWEWPHVILRACDSFTFWNLFYYMNRKVDGTFPSLLIQKTFLGHSLQLELYWKSLVSLESFMYHFSSFYFFIQCLDIFLWKKFSGLH